MAGVILVIDDVATNRVVLKVKLAAAGYQPLLASNGTIGVQMALHKVPNLILLDAMLPDMSMQAVLAALRGNPVTALIPVLIYSASHDADLRADAFRNGADEFLSKPIDDQILLARIRNLLRDGERVDGMAGAPKLGLDLFGMAEPQAVFARPGHIALIAARPETALRLRRDLVTRLPHQISVISPEEAMSLGHNPDDTLDVFLIEADLGVPESGLRLMSELRSRSDTRNACFAVLVPAGVGLASSIAFDLGANDLVTDQIGGEELALRLGRLVRRKQTADRMRASVQDGLRLAMIDPLTGLHNRRFGVARLSNIAAEAQQHHTDFAVMVVDIDRFKSVNDRFGHAAGDTVLIEIAQRLQSNLRTDDLLARIGGEEFLIALPATTLSEARAIADRLCAQIANQSVDLGDYGSLQITVSIGLAICHSGQAPTSHEAVTALVNRADQALLTAKSNGRNQVTISRSAA